MPALLESVATADDWDLHELAILARRQPRDPIAEYSSFLDMKSHVGTSDGFAPLWMPSFLFGFQQYLVDWALRKGKAAIFADCGLGKTPMQLVWAQNVVMRTNRPVLVLTPLGVSKQTVDEGRKFGIDCFRSLDGHLPSSPCIVVTNYERLHYFNPADFAGVVCDESSMLKNFDGARRGYVTNFLRKMRYRLLCTATAAPNDFIELGTSSEALGELGYMDMLGMFFQNEESSLHPDGWGKRAKWRLRPHATLKFWQWVCSWARCVRTPSDLGFDDAGYDLPPLTIRENLVHCNYMPIATAQPSGKKINGFKVQQDERRATLHDRCKAVANIVAISGAPAVVWCHLNPEADTLVQMIPGARQVSGSDSDDQKERAFSDFSEGRLRVLVTKPKIGAFGLNWQHCHHMTFFPSHSFEQFYQGCRRCWRFGQKDEVFVDMITTEGESGILANLRRKHRQAHEMFDMIVSEMHNASRVMMETNGTAVMEVPSWLS